MRGLTTAVNRLTDEERERFLDDERRNRRATSVLVGQLSVGVYLAATALDVLANPDLVGARLLIRIPASMVLWGLTLLARTPRSARTEAALSFAFVAVFYLAVGTTISSSAIAYAIPALAVAALVVPLFTTDGAELAGSIGLVLVGSAGILAHHGASAVDWRYSGFFLAVSTVLALAIRRHRLDALVQLHLLRRGLEHLAAHDHLTGALNRTGWSTVVPPLLARARGRERSLAVVYLDIDRFKSVNDGLGHELGDEVIARVALRIQRCLGPDDRLIRFGGDEFVVVLEVGGPADAQIRAEVIRRTIGEDDRESGHLPRVTASLGVAIDEPDLELRELVRRADDALLASKQSGRDRVTLWSPHLAEAGDHVEPEANPRSLSD